MASLSSSMSTNIHDSNPSIMKSMRPVASSKETLVSGVIVTSPEDKSVTM